MAKTNETLPTFTNVAELQKMVREQFSASGGALFNICIGVVIGIRDFPTVFENAKTAEAWVAKARGDVVDTAMSKQMNYKIRQFAEMAFRWERKGVDVVTALATVSHGEPDRWNRVLASLASIKSKNYTSVPDASVVEKAFKATVNSKEPTKDPKKAKPVDWNKSFAAAYVVLRDWHVANGTHKVKGVVQPVHPDLTSAINTIATYAAAANAEIEKAKLKNRKLSQNAADKAKREIAAKEAEAQIAKLAAATVGGQPN